MRKYAKELYSKEVIMKTAYAFTDDMYIHLQADEEYYLVSLMLKDMTEQDELYSRFENELIAQETRLLVSERTKKIREMIVARALSSTLIDTVEQEEDADESFSAGDILKDWFEING